MNRPVNGTLVTIADTVETARIINRYLRCSFGKGVESRAMTYRRLSWESLRLPMDLLILELLSRDGEGYRAEGIFSAERWINSGRRILIVSGAGQSGTIDCPVYWDLAAPDSLSERIARLLDTPPDRPINLAVLKKRFAKYCRPAVDLHGKT